MDKINIPIEIEGVDKSGKDTVGPYIAIITNYAYMINVRGTLSQLVYNDKFGRDITYSLVHKPLIVFLDVETNDHTIRCKINHEPKINVENDRKAYMKYIELLQSYGIKVLCYNTTRMTPMQIAEDVRQYLETTKTEDFILDKPIKIGSLGLYTEDDLKDEEVIYEYHDE